MHNLFGPMDKLLNGEKYTIMILEQTEQSIHVPVVVMSPKIVLDISLQYFRVSPAR
jgi:hypothetical protein